MSRQKPGPKHPEVAQLIDDVKRLLGCASTRDLARELGWAETDKERKLYRWARGDYAPRFADTVNLFRAAGLLDTRDETTTPAAESEEIQEVAEVVRLLLPRLERLAKRDAARSPASPASEPAPARAPAARRRAP